MTIRTCPGCGTNGSGLTCQVCHTSLVDPPTATDGAVLWRSAGMQTPPPPGPPEPRASTAATTVTAVTATTVEAPSHSYVPPPKAPRRGLRNLVAGLLILSALGGGVMLATRGGDDDSSVSASRSADGTQSDETFGSNAEASEGTVSAAPSPEAIATTVAAPVPTLPPVPTDVVATAPPVPPGAVPEPNGDLGIAGQAMLRPACDGSYIVSVGSYITTDATPPAQSVQSQLGKAPGAWYLRTDQACMSLRQVMPDGGAIYMVVFGPVVDLPSACWLLGAARAIESGAFVRQMLDTADGQPLPSAECP